MTKIIVMIMFSVIEQPSGVFHRVIHPQTEVWGDTDQLFSLTEDKALT